MQARRNGFVLVSVLWITVILTVLAIGFGRRAMLDRRAATISVDYTRVRHEARGQVQQGGAEIINALALAAILEQFRVEGSSLPQFQYELPPEPKVTRVNGVTTIEDLTYFVVIDEERKVSLNAAAEELLEELPGLTFDVVNEIIRRRGGETADDPPTPFQSIEELRALDGISDDDWFGDDDEPGLRDLVTLWGDGKINVNTASEAVLNAIPDIDDEIVVGIVEYRRGPDGELNTEDDLQFRNFAEIVKALEISPERLAPLQEYTKVESQFFRITGVSTKRGGKVRGSATAVVAIARGSAQVIRWTEEIPGG